MSSSQKLTAGVLGGLAGGVVFGIPMGLMGMFDTLASVIGVTNWICGLLIHLMMSMVIGLIFVLLFSRSILRSVSSAVGTGALYAIAWWVMGVLIAMPLMLGGMIFTLDASSWLSLMGHLMYGIVLALVARLVLNKK